MPRLRSHVHPRSYWGELDAGPLLEWLNSKARPASDPVEELIEMNQRLPIEVTAEEIGSYLAELVRLSKLAVAPVLGDVGPMKWQVDWRLVGRMPPSQGLALVKLLHLADKGLIGRVRRCAAKQTKQVGPRAWSTVSCGKWFFAKFAHQRFHSEKCQQETFKRDPDWKKQRAEYMKRLRAERKLREQWKGPKGKEKR